MAQQEEFPVGRPAVWSGLLARLHVFAVLVPVDDRVPCAPRHGHNDCGGAVAAGDHPRVGLRSARVPVADAGYVAICGDQVGCVQPAFELPERRDEVAEPVVNDAARLRRHEQVHAVGRPGGLPTERQLGHETCAPGRAVRRREWRRGLRRRTLRATGRRRKTAPAQCHQPCRRDDPDQHRRKSDGDCRAPSDAAALASTEPVGPAQPDSVRASWNLRAPLERPVGPGAAEDSRGPAEAHEQTPATLAASQVCELGRSGNHTGRRDRVEAGFVEMPASQNPRQAFAQSDHRGFLPIDSEIGSSHASSRASLRRALHTLE